MRGFTAREHSRNLPARPWLTPTHLAVVKTHMRRVGSARFWLGHLLPVSWARLSSSTLPLSAMNKPATRGRMFAISAFFVYVASHAHTHKVSAACWRCSLSSVVFLPSFHPHHVLFLVCVPLDFLRFMFRAHSSSCASEETEKMNSDVHMLSARSTFCTRFTPVFVC